METALLDGRANLGFTIAPGFRRLIPPPPRGTSLHDVCAFREPSFRNYPGGVWLGSEYGLDFRAHVLWSFPTTMSELSGAGGIVPVGRIYVAGGRIRLPSILGLLLPEVGYRMRTQSYDELGNRLSRTSTNFTLYLRPAGFNIAYLFAPEPRFALELNIAPWIDIAFHGTPAQVGFSAFVQINAGMW